MATEVGITLLKRSDGEFYKLHTGVDWLEAADRLSQGQAFVVEPLCCFPYARIQQPVNMSPHCVMLRNNWYTAQSEQDAVLQLMSARTCVLRAMHCRR